MVGGWVGSCCGSSERGCTGMVVVGRGGAEESAYLERGKIREDMFANRQTYESARVYSRKVRVRFRKSDKIIGPPTDHSGFAKRRPPKKP